MIYPRSGPNPYYNGPPAANFDGRRFFNPDEPATDRSLAEILRWQIAGTRAHWPTAQALTQIVPEPCVPEPCVDGLRITIVGHATVLIQTADLNFLTDPVWSDRASPFRFIGPKRANPPAISFGDLPRIDTILLSHNHYDHLDLATLEMLVRRDDPQVLTPLGNDTIVQRHIPAANVQVGNWGDSFEVRLGVTVDIVPANHWSSRGLRDRRMALWGGFMLRSPAGSVYFAGDTGYGTGRIFSAIRERYGPPDVALIPIGAYAPRWFMAAQHCNPEEAIRIMLDLQAKHAIGIHWGTFNLTDEPRDEPRERLETELGNKGIEQGRFVAGQPGDVWDALGNTGWTQRGA